MTDPSTVCGVSLVGLPAGTLGQVAAVGPYFAVSTGPVVEPGWRPVRALYTDQAVLAGLVGRVRVRLGVGDSRVAASILVQGHAAGVDPDTARTQLREGDTTAERPAAEQSPAPPRTMFSHGADAARLAGLSHPRSVAEQLATRTPGGQETPPRPRTRTGPDPTPRRSR